MGKTSAIIKRRKAVRNIRKITRTMELIATARFKKAMDRALAAETYTRRIAELVRDLGASAASANHPLLTPRPNPKRSLLLVLTSNRGLCGGYNANVLRQARRALGDATTPTDVEVSGKRGAAFFKFQRIAPLRTYTHLEDKPKFAEVDELAGRYLGMFQGGEIDRLDVAYTRFVSTARQVAEVVTLLPMAGLDLPEARKSPDASAAAGATTVDYEFIPSVQDILNELVPTSFKVRLFKAFLDAAVSEQVGRMIAMKGATENAGGLLKYLNRTYNRARQAQITSQICEIIGTVEALK
jgi:F-type H+-transporting ATPase subunit gamma